MGIIFLETHLRNNFFILSLIFYIFQDIKVVNLNFILQLSKVNIPRQKLTDYTNWFPSKPDSSPPAHVLAAASRCPQTHKILDTKKNNEHYFHIKQGVVGHVEILVYRRQDTQY